MDALDFHAQVRSVAGQTILPSILNGFARIANSSDPLKFLHQEISYKPFISLFNMTGVAELNPELAGIGKTHSLSSEA
jgi:prostatic aicd phosphatase